MPDVSVGVAITLKIGDSSFELSRDDALAVYTTLGAALGIPAVQSSLPAFAPCTTPWKYPMYPAPYSPDIVYTTAGPVTVSVSAPVMQQD